MTTKAVEPVRLDRDVDWDEITRTIEVSYRMKAPTTLVKQLDAGER